MKYDRELLKKWSRKDIIDEYLGYGYWLFGDDAFDEKYGEIVERQETKLKKRIKYCKKLVEECDDEIIYYTLASLYNRYKPQKSIDCLFKRCARYYALKTIKKNRSNDKAWILLAECYRWLSMIGGEKDKNLKFIVKNTINKQANKEDSNVSYLDTNYEFDDFHKERIKLIERAIYCIKKAIKINSCYYYKKLLKDYMHEKNQEYKPPFSPRDIKL